MYPAARIGDPVSHDGDAPCGTIAGPPTGVNPLTVIIESQPAAHVSDSVKCLGVTKFGLAHIPIPPEPYGPPNRIVRGSPTVTISGMPAARWSPSFDVTTCMSQLGLGPAAAARTVFIGDGIPAMPLKIAIVAGTGFDSPEGKARIWETIAEAQSILGMAIQVESMTVIDNAALKTLEHVGYEIPTDTFGNFLPGRKQKVYEGQSTLDAIESHGSTDAPLAVFSDSIVNTDGDTFWGQSIKRNPGNNKNEAVLVSNDAGLLTFAHELGHLLTNDLGHSDDVNNVMYGYGHDEEGGLVTGREWTDPWKSDALKNRYVTTGGTTVCPVCGGCH